VRFIEEISESNEVEEGYGWRARFVKGCRAMETVPVFDPREISLAREIPFPRELPTFGGPAFTLTHLEMASDQARL
jgi:hypothetical protein